jgi:hypothetical protein
VSSAELLEPGGTTMSVTFAVVVVVDVDVDVVGLDVVPGSVGTTAKQRRVWSGGRFAG